MRKIKYYLSLSIIVLLGIFLASSSIMGNTDVKEDFLVVYENPTLKTSSIENNDAISTNVEEEYTNFDIVKVSVDEAELSEITNDPEVKFVVPDVDLELCDTPNVETLEIIPEAEIVANGEEVTWSNNMILAPNNWATGITGKNIKVAILDTGIANHSDLNIVGRYDAVTAGGNANDAYGHGTAVAGIVAAKKNGIGLIGVAPDVSLYAVRVMETASTGKLSDLIDGINWSINNNMDIINMSLGINPLELTPEISSQVNHVLEEITTAAFNSGTFVVAATGNNGNSTGVDNVSYPARNSNVMGVGAVDSNMKLASFSSIGPSIDVVAPGVSVKTTGLSGSYVLGSGTSFASPNVTGLVALYKQKYPSMDNSAIFSKIISNAKDLGAGGFDKYYGNGLGVADVSVLQEPKVNVNISVNPVNDASTSITGSGPANGLVEISTCHGNLKGGIDSNGNYSVPLSKCLVAGSHVGVVGVDPLGNRSGVTNIDVSMSSGIYYRVHVQNVGWQDYRKGPDVAGTSGKALRLEGINIKVAGISGVGIRYSTHVQNVGWQGFVADGGLSGTSGKSLRLEAIKIELTGVNASKYDVYYRVHAQNVGWMGWAKNGGSSGTEGLGLRLEAIQVKIVPKGTGGFVTKGAFISSTGSGLVNYRTHVQNVGWQGYRSDGGTSGTSGRALRLEAIQINLGKNYPDGSPLVGNIYYNVHVQNIGWQGYKANNMVAGTSGRALRLEAIQIKLSGDVATKYDVYYRVHAQNVGWMGWAKNGASSGTAGFGYRLEAIQIKLVPKGGVAPGSTSNSFKQR